MIHIYILFSLHNLINFSLNAVNVEILVNRKCWNIYLSEQHYVPIQPTTLRKGPWFCLGLDILCRRVLVKGFDKLRLVTIHCNSCEKRVWTITSNNNTIILCIGKWREQNSPEQYTIQVTINTNVVQFTPFYNKKIDKQNNTNIAKCTQIYDTGCQLKKKNTKSKPYKVNNIHNML